MAKHVITINNGQGTKNIVNGSYSITANVPGFTNSTISPSTVTISEDENSYSFYISAEGQIVFHISEDGTSSGINVSNASIYRCDENGNTYGNAITTDNNGTATMMYLPYGDGSPIIYYKQTSSDGSHTFDTSIKQATLVESTVTIEVENPPAPLRTINLIDTNYNNLVIASGTITLEE